MLHVVWFRWNENAPYFCLPDITYLVLRIAKRYISSFADLPQFATPTRFLFVEHRRFPRRFQGMLGALSSQAGACSGASVSHRSVAILD